MLTKTCVNVSYSSRRVDMSKGRMRFPSRADEPRYREFHVKKLGGGLVLSDIRGLRDRIWA